MHVAARRVALPILLGIAFVAVGSRAPAQLLGPEFQVNTYTTGIQWHSSVAAGSGGEFVVTWTSNDQDGNSWGIFGQRFDADGAPLGDELQINTHTQAHQMLPDVVVDGAGNFVVVWESYQDGSREGIIGQRFDPAGLPRGGEFQVNTYTTEMQGWPEVAVNATGDFVVVWTQNDTSYFPENGIFARRYDESGVPQSGEIAIVPRALGNPSVIARGVTYRDNGAFVVGWTKCVYVSPWEEDCDVFAKGLGMGGPLGSGLQVNSYTTSYQRGGAMAADGDDDFLVVWDSYDQDGSSWGVFGRRYDADGTPLSGELQVNSHTASSQFHGAVAAQHRGEFLVVWESDGQDGSGRGIFGQRYDPAGVPIGGEFQVNSYTSGDQRYPAVAASGLGDFVVAWHSDGQDGSDEGIFGRLVKLRSFADGFESGDTSAWSSTVGG